MTLPTHDAPAVPARDPRQAPGFRRMFAEGETTLGLFFPLAAYAGDTPDLEGQAELAGLTAAASPRCGRATCRCRTPASATSARSSTRSSGWARHVGHVRQATLATGSLILPLRHPIHVAKAAASLENLSRGRLVLGVASGDRLVEFPAFGRSHAGARRGLPRVAGRHPPPARRRVPAPAGRLGHAARRQPGAQAAPRRHPDRRDRRQPARPRMDRPPRRLLAHLPAPARRAGAGAAALARVRRGLGRRSPKPVAQSLYIDLADDPKQPPRPIHLGYRLGREPLVELLRASRGIGVGHVAFVLKFCRRPVREVIQELAEGGGAAVPRPRRLTRRRRPLRHADAVVRRPAGNDRAGRTESLPERPSPVKAGATPPRPPRRPARAAAGRTHRNPPRNA